MYQLRHPVLTDGVQNHLAGRYIVAHELAVVVAADLCLQHHHRIGVFEVLLPVARLGHIHQLDRDVWLDAAQHVYVVGMLVQHDDVAIAPVLQTGDQVLADQSGAAGEDDLFVQQVCHCVSSGSRCGVP